jgi:hypothetical protein
VRTPKQGEARPPRPLDRSAPSGVGELTVGAFMGLTLAYEVGWLSPLFSLSIVGLILVGAGLARERWIGMNRAVAAWRGQPRPARQSID